MQYSPDDYDRQPLGPKAQARSIKFSHTVGMMIKFSAGLMLLTLTSAALAAPTQVIIIRHGEKANGNDLCLPQGVCRAVALSRDFTPQFGKPSAIYAMAADSGDSSNRPVETVTPLAEALGIPVHADYTRKQLTQVTAAVENDNNGGMVLISWEHKIIPQLVQTFCQDAAPGACASVPVKWQGSVYNQAWILNFGGDGKVASFKIETEKIDPSELTCGAPLSTVFPPGASVPASEQCPADVESNPN
jgi:hypothetical protein